MPELVRLLFALKSVISMAPEVIRIAPYPTLLISDSFDPVKEVPLRTIAVDV